MAKHTTFKIGGPADILVIPDSIQQLQRILRLCNENNWPVTLLGECSNVLIADEGIRGVVILSAGLSKVEINAKPGEIGYITAGAGVRLAKVADMACKAGLQGLEFAHAIPGSVGGAVYMNAGAFDHEIAGVCTSITLLRKELVLTLGTSEIGFGYRTSRMQQEGGYIVEATFRLLPGDPEEIRETINGLNARRRQKQPYEPSAGSVFKRPKGLFAGKLVEDAGLKGYTVGGAQVSEKHAGFIINKGGATAEDVCQIMDTVRKRVYERFGVWLEPEIEILGRKYPWQ
jgi:UDP-N-acetylmuramate dehydrogenase